MNEVLMPDNRPPPHVPETWVDRVWAHPELGVPVMSALAGLALFLDSWFDWNGIIDLPLHLGAPLGLIISAAGTVATIGVLSIKYRRIEQHGWHVLISGCLILAYILTKDPDHTYVLAVLLALIPVAVGLLRAIALGLIRHSARRIARAQAVKSTS